MGAAAPLSKPAHVQLDAATHTYYVDGQVVPGLTNTLKEAKIVDYSMVPQDVLQAAAWRCTGGRSARSTWIRLTPRSRATWRLASGSMKSRGLRSRTSSRWCTSRRTATPARSIWMA